MEENDYCLVSNKSALQSAIRQMQEVMCGEEYGVDSIDKTSAVKILYSMSDKIFETIEKRK